MMRNLQPNIITLFDTMTTNYLEQAIHRITGYTGLKVDSIDLTVLPESIINFYKKKS